MTIKETELILYVVEEKINSYNFGNYWEEKDCNDLRQAKKSLIEQFKTKKDAT